MDRSKSVITKYKFALPMLILSGICFLILAWKMDGDAGPDEWTRYMITEFIVKYNRLPIGFEDEIINPNWGFSYGFTPYLPSLLGAFFSKLASFFTDDARILLFACRLVNVFAGVGTVFVTFRIGDKLLDNKGSVYFMASLVGFLPQFVFLCGYLNNDVFSLLSGFMILDAVLDGGLHKWKLNNLIYLACGVSVCALSYYFGYGWILFAVAGFFYTCSKQHLTKDQIIRKTGIVVLSVLVLAGWYFIRTAIIYHGHFLGYKQQELCARLYFEEHPWIVPPNFPGKYSMHLRDMLHNGRWIETTVESLIGLFGGMVICLDGKFYDFYLSVFWVLLFMFVRFRYKTLKKIPGVMICAFLFEIVFPVGFSVYQSYLRDFQPQGRYIISIIPAIAVMLATGLDEFSKAWGEYKFKKIDLSRFGKFIPYIAAIILIVVFVIIYYTVMLPTLTYIVLPGADRVSFYYIR